MGDEKKRLVFLRNEIEADPPGTFGGSVRRLPRTVRPSGEPRCRRRVLVRAPRVGACRRTTRAGSSFQNLPGRHCGCISPQSPRAPTPPHHGVQARRRRFARRWPHGNRAKSWNTKARSGPGPVTGRPLTSTSPDVGSQQPGYDLQERCLSASRWSEQRGELPVREFQCQVPERFHFAVGLRDVSRRDRCHWRGSHDGSVPSLMRIHGHSLRRGGVRFAQGD